MRLVIAVLLALSGAVISAAQETVDYAAHVKPILQKHCQSCHGAIKQEAALRLDTGALARSGGDSGPAAVPGDPAGSLLIARVTAADPLERMPAEAPPLTPADVDVLRRWIAAGAHSPADEQPETDPREHWAFRVPRRPAVPLTLNSPVGSANPIDAFVQRELAARGLESRPTAAKPILLRRVYLDLIGLPPTRTELHAFLADESPQAYEAVVNRLLADPRYGQRWGRHWMDVWRYSDWYGRRDVNDVRNSASQIYRWRDWIVNALNEGRPYDQMLREMLAGDEIDPENYQTGVATGFLVRNYYSLNANDWMRSTVEHTGKAFLGLTFNCAHCHDHKYDPISQEDYFRLRAFFEPLYVRQDRVPGEPDPGLFPDYVYGASGPVQRLGAVRVFDKSADAPTWFYTGGDERNRLTERASIAPGVPQFLAASPLQIEPVKLPPRAYYPGLRPEIRETMMADATARIDRAAAALAQVGSIESVIPADLRDGLSEAEISYQQAIAAARSAGSPGALAGDQSLLLDATAGRAIVQNGLTQLSHFASGSTIEFDLLILRDAHVNFQLAKDVVQGLTAGYVAFEHGKILSYQPGSFSEFQVGAYDHGAGQNRFHVQLVAKTEDDICLLRVHSLVDNRLLVDSVPVALNGWNPLGDPVKAISFDARTQAVAVVDNVVITNADVSGEGNTDSSGRVLFDFEQPQYQADADVVGIAGWQSSPFAAAPAYSRVSSTAANEGLRQPWEQLQTAQRAVRALALPVLAAEAEHQAACAQLASLQTRIAADQQRFGEVAIGNLDQAVRIASCQERAARLAEANAQKLAAELALARAEAKPADDPQRVTEVQAATAALNAANIAAAAAQAAASDATLEHTYSPLSPIYPQESTGRRRALAAWLTSRDNPLTARVAINHIWLRHFHQPLVASVADFGRNGARPTHPELLDWLAVEFMESGWDMKHIHRLMVTSATYQRASSVGDAMNNLSTDSENQWLWRMNPHRMEAEVVRDSLLYCADQLDQRMGGVELENNQSLTTNRRSLYYSVHVEAGGKSEFGELFNGPDPLECYRRATSVVPQQALVLTNSQLVQRLSLDVATSWERSAERAKLNPEAEADSFITAVFEQWLSRSPSEAERRVCRAALDQQQQLATAADSALARTSARASLVRVLLNHNDFITIR